MKFCPSCGESLQGQEHLKFCGACGFRLPDQPETDAPPKDLDQQVLELLRQNKYIDAVIAVRTATDLGLRESKEKVHHIARNSGIGDNALRPPFHKRLLVMLGIALFCGLMISSAGIAVFPKIGYISKPFLCDGKLEYQSHKIYPHPGQGSYVTGVSRTFHCPDGTDRTFLVFLVSTVAYSAILFVLFLLRSAFKHR